MTRRRCAITRAPDAGGQVGAHGYRRALSTLHVSPSSISLFQYLTDIACSHGSADLVPSVHGHWPCTLTVVEDVDHQVDFLVLVACNTIWTSPSCLLKFSNFFDRC